jgi:16S rRNA (uracil1498-N3)-methyltransferase
MHRFYLPPNQCGGPTLMLTGREAHHGLRVLRLRRGEIVTVLDGAGREFRCEVSELGRDSIRLLLKEQAFIPPLPFQITLVQAIPKGKIIESIIQKATELGVARIVPLLSERVVSHLNDEKAESKLDHWRLVAIEAIKQCASTWLPEIELPLSPKAFLARGEKFDLSLIASLQPDSRHPRAWFKGFLAAHGRPPASLCVWVGPEGDLSPEEIVAVQAAGVRPITLGRFVLRSETAAVYCLSVLNYELQSAH